MLTTYQLAEVTNLAPQTIHNYVKEGIITPDEKNSSGQYLFSEEAINQVMLKYLHNKLQNATLEVHVCESAEEVQKIEEDSKLSKERRIDSLPEYFSKTRELLKQNPMYQNTYKLTAAATTIHTYEEKCKNLEKVAQSELVGNQKVENIAEALSVFREVMNGSMENLSRLSQNDKMCVNSALEFYHRKERALFKKYCIDDMEEIIEESKEIMDIAKETGELQKLIYEPKNSTVREIWKKEELKYYRKLVNDHIKKELSKGYYSLFCIVAGEERNLYRLLEKAVSPEYSQLRIINYSKATPSEQEVLRFLRDRFRIAKGGMGVLKVTYEYKGGNKTVTILESTQDRAYEDSITIEEDGRKTVITIKRNNDILDEAIFT